MESNSKMEELNSLLDSAFRIQEWLFIDRGGYPYCAANTDVMDGQPLIYSFTDTAYLQQFGKENKLSDEFGVTPVLKIPNRKIIDFLDGYQAKNVKGVWFNPDKESGSFVATLEQLRSIRKHLAGLDSLPKTTFVILHFVVKEGLMLPSADIIPANYTSHLFWRVPTDWLENGAVKTE